jgi:hypothetical protein
MNAMKNYLYIIFAGAAVMAIVSCSEEPHLATQGLVGGGGGPSFEASTMSL